MELEPVIKNENCEEIYTGDGGLGEVNLKRSYSEIGGGDGNDNLQGMAQSPQQRSCFLSTPNAGEEPVIAKRRYRRGERNVLFSAPFFELENCDSDTSSNSLKARCRTCDVVLRGHKNISSNFLRHMKRLHPEVFQIYENIKMLKHRGHAMKNFNLFASRDRTSEPDPEYFEITAMGDGTAFEEERNSETDNSAATPPDALDHTENSIESQHPPLAQLLTTENANESNQTVNENSKLEISPTALQIMSDMLDEKLKAFCSSLTQKAEDIKRTSTVTNESDSLEDRIDIQEQLTTLRQDYENLRKQMQETKQSKRQMHRELEILDKEMHRRKFIVRNLTFNDSEKAQEAAAELIRERLGLPNIRLKSVRAFINSEGSRNGKQNLLIELENDNDGAALLRNCKKLKNTGIFIEPQVSQYALKRKGKLLVLRKELLRRNAALKVFVRTTDLIVCGQHFYWDDVDGLCVRTMGAEELDAVEELKKLTGLDLREFLNFLKNYNVHS